MYPAPGMHAPEIDTVDRDFHLSRLAHVLSGPGKVARLGELLDRDGRRRAVVVTGKTLGSSPLLDRVTAALGPRCAAVFRGARQHVPRGSVNELREMVERLDADCLVSVGGGSPIDTCKAATHALLDARDLVHVAVPTTLSAGEFTHSAGVTDETTRVKSGVSDPRLQARSVVHDASMTLETPDWLWAATGMRALDHAIETCYATRHHPISDTLAAKAIALLLEHLPASITAAGGERVARRGQCLMASWFSIFGSMNTRFGISHLLGHQIGPRWDVPHGVTSCITLPHAMRLTATIAPERFGPIADGLGVPFEPRDAGGARAAALACADRVERFIARFDLPRSLRAAGVPREDVHAITDTVLHELQRTGVTDRPLTRAEVDALLDAAYDGALVASPV